MILSDDCNNKLLNLTIRPAIIWRITLVGWRWEETGRRTRTGSRSSLGAGGRAGEGTAHELAETPPSLFYPMLILSFLLPLLLHSCLFLSHTLLFFLLYFPSFFIFISLPSVLAPSLFLIYSCSSLIIIFCILFTRFLFPYLFLLFHLFLPLILQQPSVFSFIKSGGARRLDLCCR